MFQDWQTIAVCLIIALALIYVGRRGWGRMRSFRAGGRQGEAACASGCGSCGDSERPRAATTTTTQQNVLVQITSAAGSAPRGRSDQP